MLIEFIDRVCVVCSIEILSCNLYYLVEGAFSSLMYQCKCLCMMKDVMFSPSVGFPRN
jgi:hypothetical protein